MNELKNKERSLRIQIEKQHSEINRQKKAITDSIRYAGNLQKAILQSENDILAILPTGFLLFEPRDVVSGDFYWLKRIDNKLIVVAADCTGHGVPGALMSILGITYLEQITAQRPVLQANRILNRLRESIMKILRQTGDEYEQREGIDMALLIVDFDKNEVQYSGANNPLYVIRDKKLVEYKADRMPIGVNSTMEKSFVNHVISLEKNDTIYIFTDGYVDQFGGPEGKKFKYRRFRDYLIEIQDFDIQKQKELLLRKLQEWKGDNFQVDDILVIGYRFM